jgi:transglutaminase-like putative cysteine protease
MRIKTGYRITYDCPAPAPMLMMLNVHPSRRDDLETPDLIHADSGAEIHQYIDGFGNICSRTLLPKGITVLSADFVIRDTGLPDRIVPDARQALVEELPDDVIVYLLGSRYCETDKMSDLAWSLFGQTPLGWPRVQAILDYAHQRIQFGYQHARPTKTAFDAHEERLGVCRDYAHLAITLCRCMNIPARYCTGYMGDIGIPVDGVMDFSAWFEAYLGGEWLTFDARHNKPRIGRVPMARGRDATDAAIITSFGQAMMIGFEVVSEELPEAAV